MRLSHAFGLGLLVLAGCTIGSPARNYEPAKGPAGAIVDLRLADKSRITGELLAVEEGALLVRQDSQLIRISLSHVRRGSAPKVSFDRNLQGGTRDRLRLISRYPQGVAPELEGQLARAYGQSSVRSIP